MDRPVTIAVDPEKARLRELRAKVMDKKPLAPQEMTEAVEKILKYLELD